MAKGMWKAVLVVASLALLAACGGGSGGGGGDQDADVCGGATLGCVSGVVQDSTGAAIGNIVVTSEAAVAAQVVGKAATNLTTTNSQGWFAASSLAEGEQVICFESPAGATTQYVKKCKKVTITAKENTPLPSTKMATRGAAITVTNIETGGAAIDTSSGAMVRFDANEVCAADGTTVVTGSITCYLTPINVTDASVLETAPDTFVAISAADARGTMVSSAMMEVVCEQNGAELQICSGKTATVDIPIYGTDAQCKDNTVNPTPIEVWFFDDSTAEWGQYTTGTLAKNCGGTPPGTAGANQYYEGEVNHMTWINGDKWVADACLTGLVYLSAGEVTGSNVTVECYGAGWRNEVQVGNGGQFCIPVPANSAYTCKVGDSSRWIDTADYITGTASATAVTFPVDSCPATNCQETDGFIFASPILATTMTWGVAPLDLDSHMLGSGVHVYYVDKDNDVTKGSLTAAPFIALDTDDTDSYGPEVTTVMPQVEDGKYCFYVKNFSTTPNMSDPSTDQNGAAKSATVTVIGEGISKTYTVPSSNPNNYLYWEVYTVEFQGGVVKGNTFQSIDTLVESEPTDCTW